ncbi:LuxR C-terminal-related transcriptional regulator [Streptomyces sp. NPDC094468]|uniref:LuxR C-terminal-related transcriptional regulator n=1 Tax=Streptomyces sp. NPDC094468 TaxID=3366066 RepID=UPI0038129B2C
MTGEQAALTRRAVEIIAGYACGLSAAQIAERLGIRERTVHTHTYVASKRAGIAGARQAALVEYAYQHGYLVAGQVRPRPSLTPRLEEVLDCAARGLGHRATAAELGIRPKTARNHRDRLHRALGVHTTARAVAVAWEAGLRTTEGGADR